MGHYNDKFTLYRLAEIFELPSWDDILENSSDYVAEAYNAGFEEAEIEGLPEEEAEEQAEEWEAKAQEDIFDAYKTAVLEALDAILEPHRLGIEEHNDEYKIVSKNWKKSADLLAETISGFGMFEFRDGDELKEYGPYFGWKDAVLSHLHWTAKYSEVYGGRDPINEFYDSLNHYLR